MASSLRTRPMLRPHRPAYPSRLAVKDLPALLNAHQPAPWLGRREISGAMAAMLTIGGCSKDAGTDSGKDRADTVGSIAPIFDHGRGSTWGRGMLIGSVMSSPVLLPEEEAMAVIHEALAAHGIELTQNNVKWPSIVIDGSELVQGVNWADGAYNNGTRSISESLIVDGLDPQHRIAVEYVNTDDDFYRLGGDDWLKAKDVREQSRAFADEMKSHTLKYHFGTFYDPICYYPYDHNNDETAGASEGEPKAYTQEEALEHSKELLRLQVKDFVDWLKGQGVI